MEFKTKAYHKAEGLFVRIPTKEAQQKATRLHLWPAPAGSISFALDMKRVKWPLHRPGRTKNGDSAGFACASHHVAVQSALLLRSAFILHFHFSQITTPGSLFSQLLVDKSLLTHLRA